MRSIFLDIAQQIIVFAYLMDNNQDTSYMILIGQAAGLAIELWKVKKALKSLEDICEMVQVLGSFPMAKPSE